MSVRPKPNRNYIQKPLSTRGMRIRISDKAKEQLGMHPQPEKLVECYLCHRPIGGRGSTPSVTLKSAENSEDIEVSTHASCLRHYLMRGGQVSEVGMDE